MKNGKYIKVWAKWDLYSSSGSETNTRKWSHRHTHTCTNWYCHWIYWLEWSDCFITGPYSMGSQTNKLFWCSGIKFLSFWFTQLRKYCLFTDTNNRFTTERNIDRYYDARLRSSAHICQNFIYCIFDGKTSEIPTTNLIKSWNIIYYVRSSQ